MWEGWVEENGYRDLTWLVEGMKNGTIEWCAGGSYHRVKAPHISGTGWMRHCTKTKKAMKGNFWEKSNSASSYRAE